ncbi:hypothetical protein LYSHEL_07660 [Lysobacter helvus]|uniref:Tetratricopeptide repeat protein n=2 Tax=Lysobacteraceae TaxID=32033 RepID=A0ABN6FUN5_9GAMM|nr:MULTISPECIES: tetratricopeptide repeat protein [Lysobacter]BCT91742.1 hypothetical protein LYSCAS_07660 [Lysobacter caseinilyticus]BCT94895.1 hypothetical protein LYSHEL_07660 [Lysobacter helvus]
MTPAIGWPWRWQVAFALVLAMAAWAYAPGLSGGFLFDDYINLDALSRHGAVVDAPAFWRYITSGTSDPTGRPLALLSFLVDARDWPADPAPFLRTNLVLHLLNGALLWVLLLAMERTLGTQREHRQPIALLGAGLWLLHPLFVSTTLYIVQREAMLPGTFALAGLIAYVLGAARTDRRGAWLAYGGIVVATIAATLCKANGLLVPMFAWVLSATVLPASPAERGKRIAFLVVPSVLVLAYVAHFALSWNTGIDSRMWSVGERAWTQGRVLVDYLGLLAIPRVLSPGLFADGYAVSHGPFAPVSSVLSWAALVALFAGALVARRRAPRLSAALLFFFAGHVLESTLVPLELFFEHRNYVPALLLAWPLAAVIVRAPIARWARVAIGVGLLALLAATTHARADAWGHPARLAALWATRNPDSARAYATWTDVTINAGFPDRAAAWLRPKWRARPNDLQLGASVIDAACAGRGLAEGDAVAMTQSLHMGNTAGALAQDWLAYRTDMVRRQPCAGLTVDTLDTWMHTLAGNPAFYLDQSAAMQSLLGRLAVQRGQFDEALRLFDDAYRQSQAPDLVLRQAALLDANGAPRHALAHLARFDPKHPDPRPQRFGMPRLHASVLASQGYWQREVVDLRARLRAHAATQSQDAAE